jgi:hypothetical protein
MLNAHIQVLSVPGPGMARRLRLLAPETDTDCSSASTAVARDSSGSDLLLHGTNSSSGTGSSDRKRVPPGPIQTVSTARRGLAVRTR